MTMDTAPANWIDELTSEPLLTEFVRLDMPGIWLPKTRLEISQLIRLQKERHYMVGTYDEAQMKRWSMLMFHFGKFKEMEAKNPQAF